MITRREARALIRKAVKRVPEGEEIRHLNIMPMMDIMTILLVAFLFQASQAAALSVMCRSVRRLSRSSSSHARSVAHSRMRASWATSTVGALLAGSRS